MELTKPIAWMLTLPDGTHDWILDGDKCEGYIPLYAHATKTLTSKQIKELEQKWLSVEIVDIKDLIQEVLTLVELTK